MEEDPHDHRHHDRIDKQDSRTDPRIQDPVAQEHQQAGKRQQDPGEDRRQQLFPLETKGFMPDLQQTAHQDHREKETVKQDIGGRHAVLIQRQGKQRIQTE